MPNEFVEDIIKRGDLVALKEKLLSLSTTDSILDSGLSLWHALNVACELDKVEALKFFVENGYSSGDLLLNACSQGGVKAVKFLVEQLKVDVNFTTDDGVTPLHKALGSTSNALEKVKFLLRNGADIFATTSFGCSSLHLASGEGLDVTQALIQKCPSDQIKTFVNMTDDDGTTSLMIAAKAGDYDVTEYLIHHGADVNATGVIGQTALGLAVLYGGLDMVESLIEHGAKIDGCGMHAIAPTPLILASARGDKTIVQKLIQNGANVNASGDYQSFIAKAYDAMMMPPRLCDRLDGGECTVLAAASSCGHLDIVKELLACGATIDGSSTTRDASYTTPLMKASSAGMVMVVKELLSRNADMNLLDNHGDSALMKACRNGHGNVVKELIAHGCAMEYSNLNGCTAMKIAHTEKHLDIVNILVENGAVVPVQIWESWTSEEQLRALAHMREQLAHMREQQRPSKKAKF